MGIRGEGGGLILMRGMSRIALAAVLAIPLLFHAGPAAASDREDVVAIIQSYNDAGNKGDRAGYVAACAPDATVVDHVPPYTFAAPSACAKEYDAVVAFGMANGLDLEGLYQKIDNPVFFERNGDLAYAVFPVTAWFAQHGSKMVETLSLTAILRKDAGHWRIIHLTYASHGWSPVK